MCLYSKWRWKVKSSYFSYTHWAYKTPGLIIALFSSVIREAFEIAFLIYLSACFLLLKLYTVGSLLFKDLRFSSLSSYEKLAASHCLKCLMDKSISLLSGFTCLLLSFNSYKCHTSLKIHVLSRSCILQLLFSSNQVLLPFYTNMNSLLNISEDPFLQANNNGKGLSKTELPFLWKKPGKGHWSCSGMEIL